MADSASDILSGGGENGETNQWLSHRVDHRKPPVPPKVVYTNSRPPDFLSRKGVKQNLAAGLLAEAVKHGSVPSLPEPKSSTLDNNAKASLAMGKKSQDEEQEVPSIIYWHKYGNIQDLSRSMDNRRKSGCVEVADEQMPPPQKASSLLDTSQSNCEDDILWVPRSGADKKQGDYDNVVITQRSSTSNSPFDLRDKQGNDIPVTLPYLFSNLADRLQNCRHSLEMSKDAPGNRYFDPHILRSRENCCDEAKLSSVERLRLQNLGSSSALLSNMDERESSLSLRVLELEKAFYGICNSSLVDEDKLSKLQEMDQALVYLSDQANVPSSDTCDSPEDQGVLEQSQSRPAHTPPLSSKVLIFIMFHIYKLNN